MQHNTLEQQKKKIDNLILVWVMQTPTSDPLTSHADVT